METTNDPQELSWEDATSGFYGDEIKPTEAPEEEKKPETTNEPSSDENTLETPKNGEIEQNTDEEGQTADNVEEQNTADQFSQRDFITNQREFAQEFLAIKNDLVEKFGGFNDKIVAGEGENAEVIEDYTQLLAYENPRTGERFTEEEAAAWFMNQSKIKAEQRAEFDKAVEKVAEVNLDLKTGAVEVQKKYGEFLNANPELKAQIYQEFQKTLQLDNSGEVVVGMPIDIVKFYDFQLKPHIELSEARQELEKAKAEREKAVKQPDRGDILLGSHKTNQKSDGDEWSAAMDEYYSNDIY